MEILLVKNTILAFGFSLKKTKQFIIQLLCLQRPSTAGRRSFHIQNRITGRTIVSVKSPMTLGLYPRRRTNKIWNGMTKAMPFLQKAILLSYGLRPFARGRFLIPVYAVIRPGGVHNVLRVIELQIPLPGVPQGGPIRVQTVADHRADVLLDEAETLRADGAEDPEALLL